MNILLVDDTESNNEVLELLIEEWFEDKNFSNFNIEFASNGIEALEKIEKINFSLVFLDLMMPKLDGFGVLDKLKDSNTKPVIVVVTALGDKDSRLKAQKLGANAYISKPVNEEMVNIMLENYLDLTYNVSSEEESNSSGAEEFDDFEDFDDFDDFEDFDEVEKQEELMDEFNKSHKKVSSEEFLSEYDNIDYILEEINELDHEIYDIIELLENEELEDSIDEISSLFNKYATFLNSFASFYELSTSINMLSDILLSTDFSKFTEENKKFIANFIKAIFSDLIDWKEHVFVLQDAVDVYYINASSLNSCIQLEKYIKKLENDK